MRYARTAACASVLIKHRKIRYRRTHMDSAERAGSLAWIAGNLLYAFDNGDRPLAETLLAGEAPHLPKLIQ